MVKHILKIHSHKHVHKVLHIAHDFHHFLGHIGELILVIGMSIYGFTSASLVINPENELITDHIKIAQNLVQAENTGGPRQDSKIISTRKLDDSVENSFYPGYCTYGAARISPEFFPFVEDKKQQRTRGGNAIDRCENAQATGFKIGTSPSEGALIVYGGGTVGGIFGHVGKVMFYSSHNKQLIVRDMNRAGKFIMTDRWEDATKTSIKCYIYPKRVLLAVNDTTPVVTLTPTSTGNLPPAITTLPIINTTPIITDITPPIITSKIAPPVIINTAPPVIINTTPPTEPAKQEELIDEETNSPISLNYDNASDSVQHFISQWDIVAKLLSKKTFRVGDTATISFTIKDKNIQANFEGLLNEPFELISSNDNIQINLSVIQFIKDGEIDTIITASKKGETTLIINFGGEKIGKIHFTVE